jgi:hypothetical protein
MGLALLMTAMSGAAGAPTGHLIQWLVDAAGLPEVPPAYINAVATLRALRVVRCAWKRPEAGSLSEVSSMTKAGLFYKVPPHLRLVPEELCPWKHVELASLCPFPDKSAVGCLEAPYLEAIEHIAGLGGCLAGWRTARMGRMRECAESLGPLAEIARGLMPQHIKGIMEKANLPMIAACCEALDWADGGLAEALCWGMQVAGDGSAEEPGVQDTGIFRPVLKAAQYSLRELFAGKAQPMESVQMPDGTWARVRRSRPLMASGPWAAGLDRNFKSGALTLLQRAGITGEQMAAAAEAMLLRQEAAPMAALLEACPVEHRGKLKLLWQSELLSAQEVAKRTMLPPMTWREFGRWAQRMVGGVQHTRPVPRHTIIQGFKADGITPKYRAIDDHKVSGGNGAANIPESVDLISFMWPVIGARALVRAFTSRGLKVPRIRVGLDDLKHAYRTIPQALLALSVVSYYSFLRKCTVFQVVPGHSFGCAGSIPNFNRLPRLVCAVSVMMLLSLVAQYVDDFPCVDIVAGAETAQEALQLVLQVFGWDIEPTKRLPMAYQNIVLGVLVKLGNIASHLTAECEPVRAKINAVLQLLRDCKAAGSMSSGQAASFRGKLNWICTPSYGHIGRAACQAIYERQHDANRFEWTDAMSHMLEFLEAITAPDVLPSLIVSMLPAKIWPVILYTDASFHWLNGEPVAVLGMYAKCTVTGEEFYSSMILPFWFYKFFSKDLETYITQAELVAAIAAYYTIPDSLRRRAVIHFIDNTGACSAISARLC